MEGVRAAVKTKLLENGFVHIQLDWKMVTDNVPGETIFSEEFIVDPKRCDCSYFSRAVWNEGKSVPHTFWVDEEGKRHFVIQAEKGELGLDGKDLIMEKK